MKAKVVRGESFRGVLNYALGKSRAEILAGSMSSSSARELAREFSASRQLKTDCKKPVWHCSLALPNGETLSDKTWENIVVDFMHSMGFSDYTQYIAVRHRDTDHDHVHIIASRIGLDGQLWHGKWEAKTAIKLTQDLEIKYGLTVTKGLDDSSEAKIQLTKGEIEKALRTGIEPPKMRIGKAILTALPVGEKTEMAVFRERLAIAGICTSEDGAFYVIESVGRDLHNSRQNFEGVTFNVGSIFRGGL